jgi:branched-chain amino acid transport system ATP-binding protein
MSLIQIDNLEVRHGLLKAVRGVSFAVEKGETLALVGANGAGKTTLLRSLAGAHPPSAGTVRFDGNDITHVPSHKRVGLGIALVPEGRRLFAQMSVTENLMLGHVPARKGDWSVDRVLEAFPNLRPRRNALAGNLSGGEQQATAIGRALMSNPDVLLLDEISLGLSPLVVDRVYDSLKALIEGGTTIILVEQDLTRVLEVSDRVVCMLEGQVALTGRTADLSRDQITEAYFGLHKSAERHSTSTSGVAS